MQIFVTGLSHHDTPVEFRELFAFNAGSRVIQAVVGGGVALGVSALAFPPDPVLLGTLRAYPMTRAATRRTPAG